MLAAMLAAVIPCFRVKRHILGVLAAMPRSVDRIYVVDDGCPEGSGDAVEAGCTDPRVRVLRHERNRGVGAATLTGYRAALADGANVIVRLDGDGQMDPTLIPRLVAPDRRRRSRLHQGQSLLRAGGLRAMPPLRLVGNVDPLVREQALLRLLERLRSHQRLHRDPRRGAAPASARQAVGRRGSSSPTCCSASARSARWCCDVPMPARYGDEESSLVVRRVIGGFAWKHLANAAKRIFYSYYLRNFNIASIEIVLGIPLIAFGAWIGVTRWYDGYLHNDARHQRHRDAGRPARPGRHPAPARVPVLRPPERPARRAAPPPRPSRVSERITFAIPFHRGLAYLREAIESVRAQRCDAWRCLVLDDRGEAGGVADLVAGFGDARITYRANEATLGMVGNWNRALDLASTELVTLLHADDRLLPEYCDVIFALADAYPRAVAVCCDAEIIDAQGRPRFSLADAVKRLLVPRGEPWRIAGESGLRALARGDFVMCPTLAWRREQLGARRFDPAWKQVQDLDLLARLLLDGEEIAGTRRRAYAYRRHAASATARQTEDLSRFEEEFAVLDRIAARAREQGFDAAARTAERKTHRPPPPRPPQTPRRQARKGTVLEVTWLMTRGTHVREVCPPSHQPVNAEDRPLSHFLLTGRGTGGWGRSWRGARSRSASRRSVAASSRTSTCVMPRARNSGEFGWISRIT